MNLRNWWVPLSQKLMREKEDGIRPSLLICLKAAYQRLGVKGREGRELSRLIVCADLRFERLLGVVLLDMQRVNRKKRERERKKEAYPLFGQVSMRFTACFCKLIGRCERVRQAFMTLQPMLWTQ